MKDSELLKMARRFQFPNGILIDCRGFHDLEQSGQWAIVSSHNNCGAVWSEEDQQWIWEPLPSSRSAKFIEHTRYPLNRALEIAERLNDSGSAVDWNFTSDEPVV